MTRVLYLSQDFGISFSDKDFSGERKKPTISIKQDNKITKVASFNNQESFEWFLELFDEALNKGGIR